MPYFEGYRENNSHLKCIFMNVKKDKCNYLVRYIK